MVKVFVSKQGQIRATIPKLIAQAMQLKHKQGIDIIFNNGFWEFKKVKKGMVKVFLSNNNQMKITIPKVLGTAMQLQHKDKIEFIFTGKVWTIKKSNEKKK